MYFAIYLIFFLKNKPNNVYVTFYLVNSMIIFFISFVIF